MKTKANELAEKEANKKFKKLPDAEQIHMMATTAYHKMGDISRDDPSLCFISGDNWVGNWVTGYGFFHVKFPKSSTRNLTEKEVQLFNKKYVQISNQPPRKIEIRHNNEQYNKKT